MPASVHTQRRNAALRASSAPITSTGHKASSGQAHGSSEPVWNAACNGGT
jgi:hypothetical protein